MDGASESHDSARPERTMLAVAVLAASLLLACPVEPDPGDEPAVPDLRVEPSLAPTAVLACLPDIGPSRADAIVATAQTAPFVSADDLEQRVPGVGPATIGSLRPFLRFAAPDPDPAP
jgi:hypothetical protein